MFDAEAYLRNARFVPELGAPLVDLLDPQPGERVLDLGCGDGALTAEIAARGASVVGVDASPSMVAAARARGLDARVADGQALTFSAEFDAVFSNAALHWMTRPDDVLAGAFVALRPGGRFVAEMGGAGNVAAVEDALRVALRHRGIDPDPLDPWVFPTADEQRGRLERAGFLVAAIELFPRPTRLPGDLRDWLATFATPWLVPLPAADRPGLIDEVRDAVAPRLRDPDGAWTVDYVRLRFAAFRPGG